ncbi:hypothetical protein AGMMS49938_06460 [Fibrobacterales bacterium]|nr:hypothetical protein AGMMS49938_06460 [Fibrobacterales bacterium]
MQISISSLMDSSGVAFGTSGARGLVEKMTDEVCFAYTAGFLQHIMKARSGSHKDAPLANSHKKVAFGGDLRPSTPRIIKACMQAAKSLGFECDYQGFLPSPALALYGIKNGIPSVMVTGSHIPENRNGIKFCDSNGEITKEDEKGIREQVVEIPSVIADTNCGKVIPAQAMALQIYKSYILSLFPKNALANTNIALYQHSAVGRDIAFEILTELGATVTAVGRSDKFVPVDTEAIRAEDIEFARELCKNNEFYCVVSTDGDSDRPLLSDENGNWFRGDSLGILAAKALGIDAIAIPVSCNTAAEKSGFFKEVLRTKIGSPFVIEGIKKLEAKYGGGKQELHRECATQQGGIRGGIPPASHAGEIGGGRQELHREGATQQGGIRGGIPPASHAGEIGGGRQELHREGATQQGGISIAGYEANGGFLTQSLTTRDALTPIISTIMYAKSQNQTLSQLLATLPPRYTTSGLVKEFPSELADEILKELQNGGVTGVVGSASEPTPVPIKNINTTDGVRIEFLSGEIVHFRKSGNAPEFRCYTETESEMLSIRLNMQYITFLEKKKENFAKRL